MDFIHIFQQVPWWDILSMLLRWLHIITAIAWIGSSFYFIWLDLSLRKRPHLPPEAHGESWSVHGGGFYEVRKYLTAPASMPPELHWFKYESYFTWLSGFCLLSVIYYAGAQSWLIAPDRWLQTPWQAVLASLGFLGVGWVLYDALCKSPIGKQTAPLAIGLFLLILGLTWLLMQSFASRAAFLHIGAIIGTIMSGNVFFIIIPNQKKVVASLIAGKPVDPSLGKQAKQRSTHNNYLTLPVILMMISGHYPLLIQPAYGVAIIALILLAGGIIRDFFNASHAGAKGLRLWWQWPLAALLILTLALFTTWTRVKDQASLRNGQPKANAEVAMQIIGKHCLACHAAKPTHEGFDTAPQGIILDNPAALKTYAERIMAQAVLADTMPLGNETAMSKGERAQLGDYLQSLATPPSVSP